jgi:hypothetical protein
MRTLTIAFGTALCLALGAAGGAAARARVPSPIVFPVLGAVSYTDDFGAPRAGGPHQGNDLLAPRKAIAVAAEGGTVSFWTTSKSAGCMLYLHGDSGTTYLYVHLNNDLGPGNDNAGSCVAGVAYAPGLRDGARVEAGEPVGYVGDSGDANGIHPHLHFEVHPGGGAAVSPFPYLQTARHLFFAAPAGTTATLVLTGTVSGVHDDQLTLDVALVREWPAHERLVKPGELTLTVPATVGSLATVTPGAQATVWTAPLAASLDTSLGNGLVAQKLLLKQLVPPRLSGR